MLGLIRKRHEGSGWIVLDEVPNSTGNQSRGRADAIAFSIWPSRGYDLIGYEIKESREDLKKELRDPQKADNIGKFCSEWWLCVRSEALLEGLIIPNTWGILIPTTRGTNAILKVHCPAPKREPQPMTPGFVASLVRSVTKAWVPKDEHEKLKNEYYQLKNQDNSSSRIHQAHEMAKSQNKALETKIASFEKETGISLERHWNYGNIGKAIEAHLKLGAREAHDFVRRALQQRTSHVEAADEAMERAKVFYEAYGITDHAQFCNRANAQRRGLIGEMRRDDPNFACDCGYDLFATTKETETDALHDHHAQSGRPSDDGPAVRPDLES